MGKKIRSQISGGGSQVFFVSRMLSKVTYYMTSNLLTRVIRKPQKRMRPRHRWPGGRYKFKDKFSVDFFLIPEYNG